MPEKTNNLVSEEQMMTILDAIYKKALEGIPKVSKSVDELAESYLQKFATPEEAARSLINFQLAKCGTSGFLTGLGGIITLPVTLPANVTSVLYVQIRMITAIAKIGGFDIYSDQVQTLVYVCLTGSAVADILKQAGIKIGTSITKSAIKSIPGKVFTAINQKVGFRLITKFGEKGAINLVQLVPVAGGVVGGAIDIGATKIIAENAYSIFIKNEVPQEEEKPAVVETVAVELKGIKEGIGEGFGKVADKAKKISIPEIKISPPKLPAPKLSAPKRLVSTREKKQKSEKKPSNKSAIPDLLREYKSLMDEGIITQEEFEAKKKKLLELD